MKINRPTQTELDQMSHAQKDALILLLFDLLEQLEARVATVENKVEKNSQNSSKPPSSEGLKKGAAHPRKAGEKPSGGQKGHQGTTRRMVDNPDATVICAPKGQCDCGALVNDLPQILVERRQQIDIPKPQIIITEYQKFRAQCSCGKSHDGFFPHTVSPNVSYGARLKAYSVGLAQGHFVALNRVAEIVNDQYGVCFSVGSLQKWIICASERLTATYNAQCETLVNAPVMHSDESGMRTEGKLYWLHVAATDNVVHYSVHQQRGFEGMDAAGILPRFNGVVVHDCWKPYWHYEGITHALCNAHLLRELNYFEELTGQSWTGALKNTLINGKKAVATAQQEGKTALAMAELQAFKRDYDLQIAQGLQAFPIAPPKPKQRGRPKQHPATNLLIRLQTHKDAVLRFLEDWRVPFDNNLAERAVRCVKVKLKVTGGFRAMGGSEAFCIIRSIWETDKLRSQNPFETLRMVFSG